MIREARVINPDDIELEDLPKNKRGCLLMVDQDGLIYHKYADIGDCVEETKCPWRSILFVLNNEYKSPGNNTKLSDWHASGWHEQTNFSVHGYQFFYDDKTINYTQFPTMQDYATVHQKLEEWQEKEGKQYSKEVLDAMEKYDEINAKLAPKIHYGKIENIDFDFDTLITLKKPVLKGSKDDKGQIVYHNKEKVKSNALW